MQLTPRNRNISILAAALMGYNPVSLFEFNPPDPLGCEWFDPKAPRVGPTGHPKGRKFGDDSRWKVRPKKRQRFAH